MIRLPIESADAHGDVGVSTKPARSSRVYRMPDSTFFSLDVAMTKARNAYYFSTREGYEVLRDITS